MIGLHQISKHVQLGLVEHYRTIITILLLPLKRRSNVMDGLEARHNRDVHSSCRK